MMTLGGLIKQASIARSAVFLLEGLPISLFSRYFSPAGVEPPKPEQVRELWRRIVDLHERERRLIDSGVYGLNALEVENPLRHARSFLEVLGDGLRVAWRMRQNRTKDIPADAAEGMPDYYARNFHFQTDGYFSESSARRYDHQVEILFGGTAGAMRRILLPILRENAKPGGRWLEIGCGAGSATRPVLATFSRAHVTALDMSASYLKVAQDHLRGFTNVDFMQGDGANLRFKDESFDVVYSVYLLHELPREERENVMREAWRVLKPGGLLILADSLQMDDDPELNWALERFPKIYHEPFYKNYINRSLEKMVGEILGVPAQSEKLFLTKAVWAAKPG